MSRWRRMRTGDEGVALVMALVFIVVVGLFITVALEKSQATTLSGVALRERGGLEYALDGGVERASRLLQEDMADIVDPDLCESPAGTPEDLTVVEDPGGLSLNGHAVSFTCQTLAGVAAKDSDGVFTNYALVVTGTATDSFTTQSAVNDPLIVRGSIYLAGDVTDSGLSKQVTVTDGNVLQHQDTCTLAQLTGVSKLSLSPSRYRECSPQPPSVARGSRVLPPAPSATQDLSSSYLDFPLPSTQPAPGNPNGNGNGNGNGNAGPPASPDCRVFFPGRYAAPPALLTGNGTVNWFLGGAYALDFTSEWLIPQNTSVVVGTPRAGIDEGISVPSACPTLTTITTALSASPSPVPAVTGVDAALAARGGTFVFESSSRLRVAGSLRMAAPDPWAPDQPRLSLVTAAADVGYDAWSSTSPLLDTGPATSELVLNGRVHAPTASAHVFASLPSVAALRAGAVLRSLHLAASAAAQDVSVLAPGSGTAQGDPYRTVRIVARDSSGTSTAQHTAVVNVSNDAPYAVTVLSWRAQ